MPVLASISRVTTSDDYTDAATILARGARNATITISNAAVYMQTAGPALGTGGAFGQEERLVPSLISINDEPMEGLRFRSATPGTPAIVDASLSS